MTPPDIAAIARRRINEDGSINFPEYMLSKGKVCADLREVYARIVRATHADRQLAAEKRLALEWCRANGNPHLLSGKQAS
ncbi:MULTISPECIES: hypothetical protein [unclassified Sphingomonas]|uniref:hypothetical protein n=1 Tax=unclassified Sphingomonas TaxID=196159 RepID=UPI00092C9388|nr:MULTISPECIES: hypothetical protein [unclassified Sphingomonas]MBN8848185.1 hypothetical protein [Sphingomonas sp.]OJV30677.1 MAG: hypothetical protein BGO24_08150 [Sphingomonas sp. 67-36]